MVSQGNLWLKKKISRIFTNTLFPAFLSIFNAGEIKESRDIIFCEERVALNGM